MNNFVCVFTSVQLVAVFGMLAIATLAQEQHILTAEHHVEEDHYVSVAFVSLYISKNGVRLPSRSTVCIQCKYFACNTKI